MSINRKAYKLQLKEGKVAVYRHGEFIGFIFPEDRPALSIPAYIVKECREMLKSGKDNDLFNRIKKAIENCDLEDEGVSVEDLRDRESEIGLDNMNNFIDIAKAYNLAVWIEDDYLKLKHEGITLYISPCDHLSNMDGVELKFTN